LHSQKQKTICFKIYCGVSPEKSGVARWANIRQPTDAGSSKKKIVAKEQKY
jgi:hypothetical protein